MFSLISHLTTKLEQPGYKSPVASSCFIENARDWNELGNLKL
jgi:uncharacterized phosphosugar-binding protein